MDSDLRESTTPSMRTRAAPTSGWRACGRQGDCPCFQTETTQLDPEYRPLSRGVFRNRLRRLGACRVPSEFRPASFRLDPGATPDLPLTRRDRRRRAASAVNEIHWP